MVIEGGWDEVMVTDGQRIRGQLAGEQRGLPLFYMSLVDV